MDHTLADNHPRPPQAEDPLDPLFTDDTLYALAQAIPADTAQHKLRRVAAAMHLLCSLDARHPVETALATQAVLSHYASVAAFRRAAAPGQHADTTARELDTALRGSDRFTHLLHELDWRYHRGSPAATTAAPPASEPPK